MAKFLFGLLLGLVLVPLGFYLYLRSGRAPVATSAPPLPFERFFVRTAMRATIDRLETPVHLSQPSDASLVTGAEIYRGDCAVCHGLPGVPPTAVAQGMYPRPPQFFGPHAGKIDDPPREVFWKVENGIRLTGMPAWQGFLDKKQVGKLTALLEDATSLPPSVAAVLEAPSPQATAQAPPSRKTSSVRKGT